MLKTNNRIFIICILVVLLGTLTFANVLLIELKGYHIVSQKNLSSFDVSVKNTPLQARRGTIFDCNNNVIAEDITKYNILFYLSKSHVGVGNTPAYVVDKEKTAKLVAEILGCNPEKILVHLNNEKLYQTEIGDIGRGLTLAQKEAIEALGLPGIEFKTVLSRYYPYSSFAAHVIGYAYNLRNEDDSYTMKGIMGIESYLNDYLKGTDGKKVYTVDANNYELPNQTISYQASENGDDIYLTLDANIQIPLNTCLEQISNVNGVINSWGIIMEAKTGKIVAMGAYPTYDQNNPQVDNWLDYCCSIAYEPGSLLKTFVYAAAFDTNPDFKLSDTFNSNPIYYNYDSSKDMIYIVNKNQKYLSSLNNFHDRNNRGIVDFAYAYAYSLNTGTATILSRYLTTKTYVKYLESFNFYKKVGVFGLYEETGTKNLTNIVDIVNSTYGQACSYTAIQLMQAYTAFCNEGTMIKPYLIDKIVDSQTGEIKYLGKTETVGQPISAETSQKILDLMKVSFNEINSWHAGWTPGIISGGKTGTGEVSSSSGYSNETIHSILIISPIDDPKYITLIAYRDDSIDGRATYWQTYVRNMFNKIIPKYLTEEVEQEVLLQKGSMVNLINHSREYVTQKCEELDVNTISIGFGNTVIAQYPNENDTIVSGQKVFVLYGYDGISVPNMIGWSNKDILRYWDLSKIQITIEGSGYVYKQSIKQGTIIDDNSDLHVYLR